jgi:hypothetical protein
VTRPRRPRWPAATSALGLIGLLTLPAGAQPRPPRVVFEPPAVALARLDSLQGIVRAEEARVRTTPGVEGNWDRLARAWFQIGDHRRAATCLERARAIGGLEFDTALLSGRVARGEGRFAEAVDWLERAERMRPNDWETHEDLGLALYLSGRLSEAADHWERARQLPGSGSPPRTGLLEAMRRVGGHPYRVSGRGRERLRFVPATSRAMVVPVEVDGRGPFFFRIDAGTSEVVLGRSLVQELGLGTIAGGDAAAYVGERPVRFDYAVLDSLTLGATTLHDLPVAVSDHPGLGGAQGVRGTVGLEALRRFRFCLDFPDSVLWLEPPSSSEAAADTARPAWARPGAVAHRVPLLLRGTHLMVVYGRVNGGPERPFLLDTGGPDIGLAAPTSTLAEAGVAVDTTEAHTGSSAAGRVAYLRFAVGRLCVGGACRDSLAGVYGIFPARLELNPNFRLAGLVENGFLSHYRMGIDLARREVWLVEP